MLDAVQHIGNNSGSGRQLCRRPCRRTITSPVVLLSIMMALNTSLNSGQRAFLVDEMRCNISVSGAVLAADRAAQQLDNAAQLIGVCYVLEGDLGDALAGNLIRSNLSP